MKLAVINSVAGYGSTGKLAEMLPVVTQLGGSYGKEDAVESGFLI